jgi:hypothetical protein
MAYTDFTLETVKSRLGVKAEMSALFPNLAPVAVPLWLQEMVNRGLRQALTSEKARDGFLVTPILLGTEELSQREVAIYSGQWLDGDAKQGLVGECDFILSATQPLPFMSAPILTVLEAKKADIELGIAQCMAQMIGARLFNERAGIIRSEMYGCVTSGEIWQFLRLEGALIQIDQRRLFIGNLGEILAVLLAIVSRPTCQ